MTWQREAKAPGNAASGVLVEEGPEADAAATKIQATMRGRAARKIVAELEAEGMPQELVCPQIPESAGTVAQTCAAMETALHLVSPLGFAITDARLKRAGLDHWNAVCVHLLGGMGRLCALL